MLLSANKKIFSKNRILRILLHMDKLAMTMLYIFGAELSIFCTSISISQIEKPYLVFEFGDHIVDFAAIVN